MGLSLEKLVASGFQVRIEFAHLNGFVDGGQGLRSEARQVAGVELDAAASGLATMRDIVIGDEGRKIGHRAEIERCDQRRQVDADQPFVRTFER